MATTKNVVSSRKLTKTQLRKLYRQWERGERSKSEIERTELGNTTARGSVITRMFQNRLGLETVR